MNNSYSKLLLGSIAALTFTGSALAADLRVAPTRYVPTFNWTGCYGGVHAGADYKYNRNTAVTANTVAATPGFPVGYPFNEEKGVGALGGFQAGCNYQFGQWVIGAEGQFSWTGTDINTNNVSPNRLSPAGTPVGYVTSDLREPWLGTAALRFGYAWDKYLVYVKGGYGWSEFRHSSSSYFTGGAPLAPAGFVPTLVGVDSGSENRGAYMVGAGIEHMFMQNVSFKTDFEYLDYGTKNITSTAVYGADSGIVNTRSAHAYEFLWKMGVSFYFGGKAAPIVTK